MKNNSAKKPFSVFSPLILLIIALGPIGWTIFDIMHNRTDRLHILIPVSVALCIIDAILWRCYFSSGNSFESDEKEQ